MSTLSQFVGGSPIKSIQRGTISLASVSSNTATISSVDTSKAMINWAGQQGFAATTYIGSMDIQLQLASATSVSATRDGTYSTRTVSYEVIEYN